MKQIEAMEDSIQKAYEAIPQKDRESAAMDLVNRGLLSPELAGDLISGGIDYERAGRIASLIHLYYTEFDNVVGGNLHIVLDDGNIEDGYVESCMADLEAASDYLGIAIAKMLIEVSAEERARAIEAAKEMR